VTAPGTAAAKKIAPKHNWRTPLSPKGVLYAALAANLLVALTKAGAAAWTGSSAMTSEAVHSFVDTLNEVLLLYGIRRSDRRPDVEHPLGYGRELYFWSFVVAILVFALGAVVAVYEGVDHIFHPQPIQNQAVNYIVLAIAFVLDGASWLFSLRQFKAAKGRLGFYEAFRRSKDPPSFMVLFEDSAALLGILVAAIGTFMSTALHAPIIDGLASIVIGLILAATAILVARESKSLLIGERADTVLSDAILAIAAKEPGVTGANGLITVQLAPAQILAAMSLEFDDNMRTGEIEAQVIAVEQKVRAAYPQVVALFIKPQTDSTFRASRLGRFGGDASLDAPQ
jgi:cation diffusion facilitator family transporter